MIEALAAAWKWFLSTTLGRWLAAAAGFLFALAVFGFYVWRKATKQQKATDQAKDAAEQVQEAQVAQETYQQATESVAKVEAAAKAQPPPDPVKRNDFDNSF